MLLVVLLLALLRAAPAEENSQVWLEQARAAYGRQQFAAARTAAENALKLAPRSAEAEVILGLIDTSERKLEPAKAHFARAVALEPANYRTHAYLGSTYLAQGRPRDAERSFRRVLELRPDNPSAHYNLGTIALAENKHSSALEHFTAALRSNPADVPALVGLLESQIALSRGRDAAVTAGKLASAAPVAALAPLAAQLVKAEAYAPAIPLFERLAQAEPQSFEARYNLALAQYRAGALDSARNNLETLLSEPRRAEAYNLLSSVHEKAGRIAESVNAAAEAARLSPTEDFRIDHGSALARAGDLAGAARAFGGAVQAFPSSARAQLGLASVQYLGGRYEDAASTLLATIRAHPNNAAAYDLLGRAFESAGPLQPEILRVFQQHVQSKPRDPAAYTHFAAMLQSSGAAPNEYGSPREHLEQALKLEPNFAPAHYQLGVIAQAEGRLAEAAKAYEQAIRLSPEHATAYYRLAAVYQKLGLSEKAQHARDTFRRLKAGHADAERADVMQRLASGK